MKDLHASLLNYALPARTTQACKQDFYSEEAEEVKMPGKLWNFKLAYITFISLNRAVSSILNKKVHTPKRYSEA